jgi:Fe-S-cluster containining protein
VSFYWGETDDGYGRLPVELTVKIAPLMRAMKGTTSPRELRCIALEGRIGECVSCAVYEDRPSPCRDFQAAHDDGIPNPRCDEARARHGLAPLGPWNYGVRARARER